MPRISRLQSNAPFKSNSLLLVYTDLASYYSSAIEAANNVQLYYWHNCIRTKHLSNRSATVYITGYGSTLYVGMATVWGLTRYSDLQKPLQSAVKFLQKASKNVQELIYAGLCLASPQTVSKTRKMTVKFVDILGFCQSFFFFFSITHNSLSASSIAQKFSRKCKNAPTVFLECRKNEKENISNAFPVQDGNLQLYILSHT